MLESGTKPSLKGECQGNLQLHSKITSAVPCFFEALAMLQCWFLEKGQPRNGSPLRGIGNRRFLTWGYKLEEHLRCPSFTS